MNAKELFPDKDERDEVRGWLELFCGQIIKVTDENGEILYRNKLAVDF